MRILLIEDDPMIGRAVRQGLAGAGFTVDWVTDGRAAELSLANDRYDLAVLDLGLPKKDGLAVLATLRSVGESIPVLIASARDTIPERIAGLEGGADDYIAKPFDLGELIARVRAQLRRRAGFAFPVLCVGDLTMDPGRRLVTFRGEPVTLTPGEFGALQLLMEQPPDCAVSLDALAGAAEAQDGAAIEVVLHNLRRKLGTEVIRSVRGVGVQLAADKL